MANTARIVDFLAELAKNNSKEWMDAHRQEYQQARQEFKTLIGSLLEKLKVQDSSLLHVTAADCIYRINRDIRFSSNKAPYKDWMAAAMAEGGRAAPVAHYYLHLQPGGESLLAGGIYMPPPDQLRKIRQEIDYNAAELKKIVETEKFTQYFGPIQGEELQRAPKDYPADHPHINLLKLKSLLAIRTFSDEEVKKADFEEVALDSFSTLQPFLEYLNVAIS